jgi:hypothetical protein
MKRKILLQLMTIVFFPYLLQAEWIPLNKEKTSSVPPNVTLISDDNASTILKIDFSGFDLKDFRTASAKYQKVDLLSESFTNQPGFPELPYLAKVLAIPDQAAISVEVIETGEMQTLYNIHLPPARDSWFEGSPEPLFTENEKVYQSQDPYPGVFAKLDDPSVFRDFRITRVSVFPMQYFPAKNELQVFNSITVEIKYGTGEVINPKTTMQKPIAPSFGALYNNFIFNYENVLNKNYGGKETGHDLMLCIMPDGFVTSFQTYADWKRRSGIDIHITKFSDIGATATNSVTIKNHITDAYHNWAVPPTYVLVVGDYGVFPDTTANGYVSENYFVEIDGNDYFPELMIGRFTNESDYQMQVMITKFLKYEKTPYVTSTDWFKKGVCCSNNAYPSQAETKRFAADRMLVDGGFTSVDTMMMPASGCPYTLTDVKNAINAGRSFLNYRGEGWYTGWWASCYQFSVSDVTSIANGEKFTFVTSIGCGVANFTSTTSGNCFGEEWLEVGTIGSSKGAAAFVGPTGNTHTAYNNNIDRGIYVGMFQEGLETPGQALLRGKLYMYNVFGGGDSYVSYHYKIYCVLGDPSLHIWKEVPKAITVSYPALIPPGSNLVEFTVNHTASGLPVANAVVCVSGTNIFTTGITDATGKAYLDIFYEVEESLNVTVRGGDVIPYLGILNVFQPTGPYVIRETYSLNDVSGGNGNGLMDYGESILLSLTVKNVGTQPAPNVNVTLSTTDPYITFTDSFHSYGNIAAGQSILATNAFAFDVAGNIPDQHIVVMNVAAVSGTSTWNSNFSIIGNAPSLSLGTITISDPTGNNNGRLDPGETANITFPVENNGHSLSPSASAVLSSLSPYINILSGTTVLGQIAPANTVDAVFSISCSPSTPIGQTVDLTISVTAGNYGFNYTHNTPVGLVLEDWELGNFSRFPWTFGGNANWAVVSANQYEGAYTAISGAIEDNQTSEMSLQLLVNTSGNISFYRKTSSESNYDYLRFYIDGVQQAQWSGDVAWSQVSYPVTAGVRTFKWTYLKDGSLSSGSDCVWVDYIIFPASTIIAPEINVTPVSYAKIVVPAGVLNDVLNISNIGTTPLDFTAQVDYSSAGESLATVYPSNISYWTGSCTSTAKTQTSLVKGYPPNEVGWMMFDVSNIPDGAVINSVEFHGYVNATNYPYWNINPVSCNPLTAPVGTLYSDIRAEANSGYYLYRNEPGSYTTGWKTHVLGGNVSTDLHNALAQNWFAIGIMDRDVSAAYYIGFDGWNETNKPYLVIDYTFTPTFTWLKIDGGTALAGSIAGGNSQDITVTFDAGTYPVGTYNANIKITSNDADESLIMLPCTMIISNGINVSLKAMLEGAFGGTSMTTTLNGILPTSQPYNTAPWNYTGTESVTTMPSNAVDWVLVELRDATSAPSATAATRIARQAALLLNNGNIVATDGTSPLYITSSVSHGLFAVIHHRNHLAIISANAIAPSGVNFTYDFTTASGQAYGTNPQKQLATGIWGMISGDTNGNGSIGNDDLTPAWNSNAGKTGYLPGDLNFNRHVNNPDKDGFWYPNRGKSTFVP